MNSYFFTLIISLAASIMTSGVLPKSISDAFAKGDANVIASYFAGEVDLNLAGKEDVYSKAQAELVLKKFFQSHPPKAYATSHNGKSKSDTYYAIGTLSTTKGKFRTYLLYKQGSSKIVINELRIEADSQ